jgi:hypothetical protein
MQHCLFTGLNGNYVQEREHNVIQEYLFFINIILVVFSVFLTTTIIQQLHHVICIPTSNMIGYWRHSHHHCPQSMYLHEQNISFNFMTI